MSEHHAAEIAAERARSRTRVDEVYQEWGDAERAEARNLDIDDVGVDGLRELIADAARNHGAMCGAEGHAFTSPAWRSFRVLLAKLAEAAKANSRERCCLSNGSPTKNNTCLTCGSELEHG